MGRRKFIKLHICFPILYRQFINFIIFKNIILQKVENEQPTRSAKAKEYSTKNTEFKGIIKISKCLKDSFCKENFTKLKI